MPYLNYNGYYQMITFDEVYNEIKYTQGHK